MGNDPSVGVEEQSAIVATVSPNPTKDKVTLEANVASGEVAMFDMFGKQLLTTPVIEGRAEIDLSAYAKGVYVARISSEMGTSIIKLVKD